jgi:predicted nucleic acid-binding protein
LGYAELTTVVVPTQIGLTIMADPTDDTVLACALAANADWIVSGDRHLHSKRLPKAVFPGQVT